MLRPFVAESSRRPVRRGDPFEFTFNGKPVLAYPGESVAVALVRSGVWVFSRSMKFHRPRGLYCGAGNCFSCAMRVNGVPGVRTCSTPATNGMVVESEGGSPSTRFDLFSAFDHIFRKQFDYQSRFIRPRVLVPLYQKSVRRLSSPRLLPDSPHSFSPLESKSVQILIVGHGISGSEADIRLRESGIEPLVVETAGTDSSEPLTAFGVYDDGRVGVVSEEGGMIVNPSAVLLATGRIETGIDIVNSDLPGVLLPHAVESMAKHGIRPGRKAVIVGSDDRYDTVVSRLREAGCDAVDHLPDPNRIVRIVGRNRVKAIDILEEGGRTRRISSDAVVMLGPQVPSVGLAQQAGCELTARAGHWCVKVDDGGRTKVSGVFACGSVTGLTPVSERKVSGQMAAQSIVRFLGAR